MYFALFSLTAAELYDPANRTNILPNGKEAGRTPESALLRPFSLAGLAVGGARSRREEAN